MATCTVAGATTLNPTTGTFTLYPVLHFADETTELSATYVGASPTDFRFTWSFQIEGGTGTALVYPEGGTGAVAFNISDVLGPLVAFVYPTLDGGLQNFPVYQGSDPVSVILGAFSFRATPVTASDLWPNGFSFTASVESWDLHSGFAVAQYSGMIAPVPLPAAVLALLTALAAMLGVFRGPRLAVWRERTGHLA